MIVAWLIAPEANASAMSDIAESIGSSVDCINLTLRNEQSRQPWMDRIGNLRVMPDSNLNASRLGRADYCLLLREGWGYPAGYVRRMIATYNDIAIDRKIVGVEGVIYSDFFDGSPTSQLRYESGDGLDRPCLVNQLGLGGIVFRPVDIDDFSPVDLLDPQARLDFAVQGFRRNIPQICIARGPNWLKRHKTSFGRHDSPPDERFVREAQEIAGFGRLPVRYLDSTGNIPTHSVKSTGQLIANEEFRNVVPSVHSLVRMGQVAPHWFVDFLGSQHEFAVSVSQSEKARGLRIAVDRAARALRLLTPLDPAALGSRTLRAEIVLRGSDAEKMHPLIDGVYLVTMTTSGKPEVISRIFGSIANNEFLKTYSAEIKTPPLDSQLDIFFCIQLSSECSFVDLASASLFEANPRSEPDVSIGLRPTTPPHKTARRPGAVGLPPAREPAPAMTLLNQNSAVVEGDDAKPRMAVICCSLSQNALGRAYTLGEVASREFHIELLGTFIPRRGTELWAPLRDAALPIRGFVAADVRSYLSALRSLSGTESFDVVYVSKPRLTSLLLGMILSARDGCPLILDIDDLELAFLQNQSPLTLDQLIDGLQSSTPETDNPTGEIWARYCDTLAREADAITVSNEALASRFGGIVLRHARDESKFVPDESIRRDVRYSLGIREKEKVVFFLGTPRDHKGLMRIADAIVRRADPDLTMCVMGLEDPAGSLATIARQNPQLVRIFGTQPYARLSDLIQCADAVCLLQDVSSAISEYQSPAKMGEALAMGLPVLVSRVGPFSDLISSGIVIPVDTDAELQIALDGIRDGRFNLAADRNKRMAYFGQELSFASNAIRLRAALELASANYPTTSPVRLATLRKLGNAFRNRFGVDILELHHDADVGLQPEEVV